MRFITLIFCLLLSMMIVQQEVDAYGYYSGYGYGYRPHWHHHHHHWHRHHFHPRPYYGLVFKWDFSVEIFGKTQKTELIFL